MLITAIRMQVTATYTVQATGPGGTYTIEAGNYLHVVLDDFTNSLTARYSSSTDHLSGDQILTGPNLYTDPTGKYIELTPRPFYQYCEYTTLHMVFWWDKVPYGYVSHSENVAPCTNGGVCDLAIATDPIITPVTAPGATDGAIRGTATTSNGPAKFSFDKDFKYGVARPGGLLTPLNEWVSVNRNSEPAVWTTGIDSPYLTVTPPTGPAPSSDFLVTIYKFWPPTQKYIFEFSFTCISPNAMYRIISISALDFRYEPIYGFGNEKNVGIYGSAEGNTITGTWELSYAPEGMRFLGIYVTYYGPVAQPDTVIVNYIRQIVVDDAANVKTVLEFDNLAAGTYTVYAKDAGGCTDEYSFDIAVTTVNNVRYRMEFKDFLKVSSRYHRIDIQERAYVGPIEEVCGGAQPVMISYIGDSNDPSKPLIPSNMEIQLMCQVPEEFSNIPLGDDRKYLVKYFTDTTPLFLSPQIYWAGYIIPEFTSEPYMAAPYEFTITASDQIGELKNLSFLNSAGSKYRGEMNLIAIISEVFKQSEIPLPIRCGVNVWAEIMNQTGDPLSQAFADMRIFDGKTCEYVLTEIAKVFRAQIFQSMGYWWIIRLSDAVGSFAYREFTAEGIFIEFGTFGSVIELGFPNDLRNTGAMFADRRQLLTRMRNYGTFNITHDLKKDGNLIDEGAFEEDDIELLSTGNLGFKKWSVAIGQSGINYGLEHVDNGTSKGAFFFDLSQTTTNQSDTVVYTDVLPFDSGAGGKIRLKFQYTIAPKYSITYARIAWGLKFTSTSGDEWWLGQGQAGNYTIYEYEVKNGIYVTSFDAFQTFDLLIPLPNIFPTKSIQIFFWFHDHKGRDFNDITELKAYSIPKTGQGMKVMLDGDPDPVNPGSKLPEIQVYKAEYSYDAEDLPIVVRPNDYNAGDATARLLWRREEIMGPIISGAGLINRITLDNVVLASYPREPTNAQIIDPPETLDYTQVVAPFNRFNFQLDVIIGDMLRIDEETDHYKNEKYIYRSWLRIQDGTPTQFWHRLGVAESKRLLRITLEDYISQFSQSRRKLSGIIISSQIIHFINCLRDNADPVFARYRPMTLEFDVKNAAYTIEMSAVDAGPDGQPVVKGQYNKQQFSNSYNIGT